MDPAVQACWLAGLQLGSATGGTTGTPESWRESFQDVSFLLLPSFFAPQLWLLSWIPVALLPLLFPSALVLEKQLSFSFSLAASTSLVCSLPNPCSQLCIYFCHAVLFI